MGVGVKVAVGRGVAVGGNFEASKVGCWGEGPGRKGGGELVVQASPRAKVRMKRITVRVRCASKREPPHQPR